MRNDSHGRTGRKLLLWIAGAAGLILAGLLTRQLKLEVKKETAPGSGDDSSTDADMPENMPAISEPGDAEWETGAMQTCGGAAANLWQAPSDHPLGETGCSQEARPCFVRRREAAE